MDQLLKEGCDVVVVLLLWSCCCGLVVVVRRRTDLCTQQQHHKGWKGEFYLSTLKQLYERRRTTYVKIKKSE